jgi:hypothetical protein
MSDADRAAWAAQNALEEADSYARYQPLPFIEKLRILEARGRALAALRERLEKKRTQAQQL